MIEAMKLAYADRATFLGDPASVDAPLARLLSKNYAAKLRSRINAAQARPARDIYSGGATLREGGNTTHFSVVDRFGNAVSNTTTLNFSYGLGLVADGTGILLNNELDDFAAKPGALNVIDRKLSIADAVAEPRIHHQWLPDEVMVERGLRPDLIRALEARGHTVAERLPPTSANSILVTVGGLVGAPDNRTRGALAAGY
jgi:gamma-glutamyltranspeptidase/glutathione hydrolase